MISDVFIVYDDKSQIKEIGDFNQESPIFHLIDALTKQGKKDAKALKGHWASRKNPFAIAMDGEKPLKAFYAETGENVIESVLNFIKDYNEVNITI